MQTFYITINIHGKPLVYKAGIEVNWSSFKRFKVYARNATITIEKHVPSNGDAYWRVVGWAPQTAEGNEVIEKLKLALENHC